MTIQVKLRLDKNLFQDDKIITLTLHTVLERQKVALTKNINYLKLNNYTDQKDDKDTELNAFG